MYSHIARDIHFITVKVLVQLNSLKTIKSVNIFLWLFWGLSWLLEQKRSNLKYFRLHSVLCISPILVSEIYLFLFDSFQDRQVAKANSKKSMHTDNWPEDLDSVNFGGPIEWCRFLLTSDTVFVTFFSKTDQWYRKNMGWNDQIFDHGRQLLYVCVCGCTQSLILVELMGAFSISITEINNQMPNYSAKKNITLHVPNNNTFLPMFVYTPH